MGIGVVTDRHVPQTRTNNRSGPKQFELYDFFLKPTNELMELSEIKISVNQNSQSITLQEFIVALTPEDISNFGRKLSTTTDNVIISRIMTRLPQIALQTSPKHISLAETIVAKSPPKEEHAPKVESAVRRLPELHKAASVGILTWIWNQITSTKSWSDFPAVKTAIEVSKPLPWYTRLYQAIFSSDQKSKDQDIGSKMSKPSPPSSPSLPGSPFRKENASNSLPGSPFLAPRRSSVDLPGSPFAKPQVAAMATPVRQNSLFVDHQGFETPGSEQPSRVGSPVSYIKRDEQTPKRSGVNRKSGADSDAVYSPLSPSRTTKLNPGKLKPSAASPSEARTLNPKSLKSAFDAASPSTTNELTPGSPSSLAQDLPGSPFAAAHEPPSSLVSKNRMALTPRIAGDSFSSPLRSQQKPGLAFSPCSPGSVF